ncbi:MAG: response regulator transcription factor [Pseudomonadota bacterium]|nr:response regulator transcription factor [Pseudomonadota bacterium]
MTLKVLIVDDSKLARMAIIKALDSVHPELAWLEASDADTALAVLQKDGADIALLDFNMPGKDGLALAAEMRKLVPQIRVAVISANRQAEVVARARATGASFLPKPVTAQALGEFLDDALAQRGTP